jgi:hypothetical protein
MPMFVMILACVTFDGGCEQNGSLPNYAFAEALRSMSLTNILSVQEISGVLSGSMRCMAFLITKS